MKTDRDIRIQRRGTPTGDGSAPFGVLFRELAGETKDLLRQEVTLAKLELKDTATSITRDAVKIGVALALAAAGGLALTACLVLVIGNLLDGAYWAGALIVGGLFLLVGGIMASSGLKDLKRQHFTPDETLETLREDKQWARREAKDFKREITA